MIQIPPKENNIKKSEKTLPFMHKNTALFLNISETCRIFVS